MTFVLKPTGLLPEEVDEFDIRMGNLKTIDEWSQEPGMPVVLDPDGFDRADDRLEERLFTEDEFVNGAMMSTVMPSPDDPNIFDLDDDVFFEPFYKDHANDGWD